MGSVGRVLGAVWAGFARRCPACRGGRMYEGMYRMHDACAACGHRFEPSPGEFTGGLMLAQGGLGTIAAVGFIWLWLAQAPKVLQYGWLGFWLVLMPILLYPNIKGAWLGFLHGVGARPPG
jgi:uncharacterized protein (DUF983 family)